MLNEYYLTDDIDEPILAHAVLSYVTPSVSARQFHELKTGQLLWDAQLDLTGLPVEEARKALLKFLHKQLAKKHYSLLIIHGREQRKNAFPLLKNLVNHWLPQISDVAAFHSASPKDGGSDAVYVLLKKTHELPELARIEKASMLIAETKAMERQRRLAEQQGERRLASVKARDHSQQDAPSGPEGELQNSILQHPALGSQRFDGVDSPLNPEPPLNTEARREFDNERRNQEQEKQLRLGHMPKFNNTPRPRGPQ